MKSSAAALLKLFLSAQASRRAEAIGRCFADKDELKTAVVQYLDDANCLLGECEVAKVYGYPMNSWCVGNVTDVGLLFDEASSFKRQTNFGFLFWS